MATFGNLLSPLAIGPVTLRNRIVSSSHQTPLVADPLPTDEFVAYQAARAAGETGLIIMEAVAVAPSGLLTAHTLAGYQEPIVGGYRRGGGGGGRSRRRRVPRRCRRRRCRAPGFTPSRGRSGPTRSSSWSPPTVAARR